MTWVQTGITMNIPQKIYKGLIKGERNMSNAILKKETYNFRDGFKIIVDEKKSVDNIEYQISEEYHVDKYSIIKNNNVIFVYFYKNNKEINKKMFIKSIDRISIIAGDKDLHIELTIELME